jgi:TRAP-type C4-dicarboxylate transport system permease small subunit
LTAKQALLCSACLANGAMPSGKGLEPMKPLKKVARGFADFIEVYLPIAVFVIMFIAFLVNVVFRYILRNPQNWTFEFCVNAFVVVGLLGACAAYRREDHVVFDLLYNRLGARGRNLMRLISHAIVIVFFLIALPPTAWYLWRLPSMTSIMRIPERYLFAVFPIMLVSMVLRSAYRLAMDIVAFRNKTYVQTYNVEAKDELP